MELSLHDFSLSLIVSRLSNDGSSFPCALHWENRGTQEKRLRRGDESKTN
jgi:hypothetical protein